MSCQNHPESAATGTCSGCAEPFCGSCLVAVRGQTYCAACKSMASAGLAPQSVVVCHDAKSALGMAFVGLFFGMFIFLAGIVLGALALAKAAAASSQIKANPALGGKGWVAAARVVGLTVALVGVLSMVTTCGRVGR